MTRRPRLDGPARRIVDRGALAPPPASETVTVKLTGEAIEALRYLRAKSPSSSDAAIIRRALRCLRGL